MAIEKEFTLRNYQKDALGKISRALDAGKNVVLNMPTGSGKTLTVLSMQQPFNIYTRTHSQYTSWERDSRKLELNFSGLIGKAKICKFSSKQSKMRSSEESDHPIEEEEEDDQPILPKCKDCEFNIAPQELDPDVDEVENTEEWDEIVDQIYEKGVETYNLAFVEKKDSCGYYASRNAHTKIKLYSYIVFFLLNWMVRQGRINVFDEAHNSDSLNELLGKKISEKKLNKIEGELYNRVCGILFFSWCSDKQLESVIKTGVPEYMFNRFGESLRDPEKQRENRKQGETTAATRRSHIYKKVKRIHRCSL